MFWVILLFFILLLLKISIDRSRNCLQVRSYPTVELQESSTLQVTNLGPGHMIQCFLLYKVTTDQGGPIDHEYTQLIPLIGEQKHITVQVPDDLHAQGGYIRFLKIEYTTQANERIQYFYRQQGGKTSLDNPPRHAMYIITFWGNKPLIQVGQMNSEIMTDSQ